MRSLFFAALLAAASMTSAANAAPAFATASLSSGKSESASSDGGRLLELVRSALAFFGVAFEASAAAGEAGEGKKKSVEECDAEKDAKAKPAAQNGGEERRQAKKELLYLAF